MRTIFCSDPLDGRKPDSAYESEVSAASTLGIDYSLFDYEALVYEDNPAKATRKVTTATEAELAIYRGWMLKPEKYSQLYAALLKKGVRLINDPAAYRHCHYLPASYSVIEGCTPKSVWMKVESKPVIDQIMRLLQPFGSKPLILKDFVKSRKHEWEEACYIPSASDQTAVEQVVHRFLELQGEDLNDGLVFREFVEFEPLTKHSKSGMPLIKEFRLFFLDHQPVFWTEYWEEGDYSGLTPPIEQFREVANAIQSHFFTMDIAKRLNGEWMIVELGDAQVAGLPENADVLSFYKALE